MRLCIEKTWDGRPIAAPDHIDIDLERGRAGWTIRIDAPFVGDPAPGAPPGPTDRLWEHEVVELFVLGDSERYVEVELGPHGHHLVLVLHGRRNVVSRGLPLDYRVERLGDRWRGAAALPIAHLPRRPAAVNAYAIHGVGPARRYLAWRPVPGDGPDFHRLEHFAALSP